MHCIDLMIDFFRFILAVTVVMFFLEIRKMQKEIQVGKL